MELIYAPQEVPSDTLRPSVFLAGSIDNGAAEDWQQNLIRKLQSFDVRILNPRRLDWDASWKESIHNRLFREQVEWELAGLRSVDYIFMHLAADSAAPISLLELGLMAADSNMIISCTQEFWKRGNVEIIAEQFEIPLYNDFDVATQHLIKCLTA